MGPGISIVPRQSFSSRKAAKQMLPNKTAITMQRGSQGKKYYLLISSAFTPLLVISYSFLCSYNKIFGAGVLYNEKKFLWILVTKV